jgi:hypothetical protein
MMSPNTAAAAAASTLFKPTPPLLLVLLLLLLLLAGLCPQHMKADAVRLKGGGDQLWRFCQQVGGTLRLHDRRTACTAFSE